MASNLPHSAQDTWHTALNSTPTALLSAPASHAAIELLHSHSSENNTAANSTVESAVSPPNLDFYAYEASPANSSARLTPGLMYAACSTASGSPPRLVRPSPPLPVYTGAAAEETTLSLSHSETRVRRHGTTANSATNSGKVAVEPSLATHSLRPLSASLSPSLTCREVGPAASTDSHVSHFSVDSRKRRQQPATRAAPTAPAGEHASPSLDCIAPQRLSAFLNNSLPNETNGSSVFYQPSNLCSGNDVCASDEDSEHSAAVSSVRPVSSRYISESGSHLLASSARKAGRESEEGYVLFPVHSSSNSVAVLTTTTSTPALSPGRHPRPSDGIPTQSTEAMKTGQVAESVAATPPQHVSPSASPLYCGLYGFPSASSTSLTPAQVAAVSSSPVPPSATAAKAAAPRHRYSRTTSTGVDGQTEAPQQRAPAQQMGEEGIRATRAVGSTSAAAVAVAGRRSRPLSLSDCSALANSENDDADAVVGGLSAGGANSAKADPLMALFCSVTKDPAEISHTVAMPLMLAVHDRSVTSPRSGETATPTAGRRAARTAPLCAHTDGSNSSTRSRDEGLSITSPHTSKNTLSTASGSTVGTAAPAGASAASAPAVPPAASRGVRNGRRQDLPPLSNHAVRKPVLASSPLSDVAPLSSFFPSAPVATSAAAGVMVPWMSLPAVVPVGRGRDGGTPNNTVSVSASEDADYGRSGVSASTTTAGVVASAVRLNLRSCPVEPTTAAAATAPSKREGYTTRPSRRLTRPPPHPRSAATTMPVQRSGATAAATTTTSAASVTSAPHTVRRFVLRRASLRSAAQAAAGADLASSPSQSLATVEEGEEKQEAASAVLSSPPSQPHRCLSTSLEVPEASRVSGSPAIPQLRLHELNGNGGRYPGVSSSLLQSTSTTSTRSGTRVPSTKRRLKSRPLMRSQQQQLQLRGSVTASTTSSFGSAMPQRQTQVQASFPSLSLSLSQPTTLVRGNPRRSLTSTSIACCSTSTMAAADAHTRFSEYRQQQQQQLVTPRPRGATPGGSSVSSPIVVLMSGSGFGDVVTRVTATNAAATAATPTSNTAPLRAVRPRYMPQFTRPLRAHPKHHYQQQQQQQHDTSSASFVSSPDGSAHSPRKGTAEQRVDGSVGSTSLPPHPPSALAAASLSLTTIMLGSHSKSGSSAAARPASVEITPADAQPSPSSALLLPVQPTSTQPAHGAPLFAEEEEGPTSCSRSALFARRHEAAAAAKGVAASTEGVACRPPPPNTAHSVEGPPGCPAPADVTRAVAAAVEDERTEPQQQQQQVLGGEKAAAAPTRSATPATPHSVVALPPPLTTATAAPSSSQSEKDVKIAEVQVERLATRASAVAGSAETTTNTRPVEVETVHATPSSGAARHRKTIVEPVNEDSPTRGVAAAAADAAPTLEPHVVEKETETTPSPGVAVAVDMAEDGRAAHTDAANVPHTSNNPPLHYTRHGAAPFLCAAIPSINDEYLGCETDANTGPLHDTVAVRASGETLTAATTTAAAAAAAYSVSSDVCCGVVPPTSPLSAASMADTSSSPSAGGVDQGIASLTETGGATGASAVTTAAAMSSLIEDAAMSITTPFNVPPLTLRVTDAQQPRLSSTGEEAATAAAAAGESSIESTPASPTAPDAVAAAPGSSEEKASLSHHRHPTTMTLTNAAAVTETPTATACYHKSALYAFFAAGSTGGAGATTAAPGAAAAAAGGTGRGRSSAMVAATPARAALASSFYSSFDRSSMRDDTAVATAATMIFNRDPSSSELGAASLNGRGALARSSSSPITRLTTLLFTYSSATHTEFGHSHEDGGATVGGGGRTPSHLSRSSALMLPSAPTAHGLTTPSSAVSSPAVAAAVEDDVVGVRSVDTTAPLHTTSAFASAKLASPLRQGPQQQTQPPPSPTLCTVPSSLALSPPLAAAAPTAAAAAAAAADHTGQITTAMTAAWCSSPALRLQPSSLSALRPLAKRRWSSAVAPEVAAAVLSRRTSIRHTAAAVARTGPTPAAASTAAPADAASREPQLLPVMDPTGIDRLRMEVCATTPHALRRTGRSFRSGGTNGSSDTAAGFPQRVRQSSHQRSAQDGGERRGSLDCATARRTTRISPQWLSNRTATMTTPSTSVQDTNASREDSSDPTSSDSGNNSHTHHHRSNSREVTHLSFPSIAALMLSDDDDDDLLNNAPHAQAGLILVECDNDIEDVLRARAEVMRRTGRRPSDSRLALRRASSRFSHNSSGGGDGGGALMAAKPCLQPTSSFANRRWGDRRPHSGSHTRHDSGVPSVELLGVEKEKGEGREGVAWKKTDITDGNTIAAGTTPSLKTPATAAAHHHHHHRTHSGDPVSQLRRAHPSVNRCAAAGVDDASSRSPWPAPRTFLLRPHDGGSESDDSADAAASHTRAGGGGTAGRATNNGGRTHSAASFLSADGSLLLPRGGEDGPAGEGGSAAPTRVRSTCAPTCAGADAAEPVPHAAAWRRRTRPMGQQLMGVEESEGRACPSAEGDRVAAMPVPRMRSGGEPEDGGLSPELSILGPVRHRPLPLTVETLALPDSAAAAAVVDGASPANVSTTMSTAAAVAAAKTATLSVLLPPALSTPQQQQRRDRRASTAASSRRRGSPSGVEPEPRPLQAAGRSAAAPPPTSARSVLSESLTTVEGELVHLERPLQQQQHQQHWRDATNNSFAYHPLTLGELGAGMASPLLGDAISRSAFTFRSGFSSALVSNADSHFDEPARRDDLDSEESDEEMQLAVVVADPQCSASRRTASLSQPDAAGSSSGSAWETNEVQSARNSDTLPVVHTTQVRANRIQGSGAEVGVRVMISPPPVHGVPSATAAAAESAVKKALESQAAGSQLPMPHDALSSIPFIVFPAEMTSDEEEEEEENGDENTRKAAVRSPCSSCEASTQRLSPLQRNSAAVCPSLPFTLPAPPAATLLPPSTASDNGSPSVGPGILIPSRKWLGSSAMTTPAPAPFVLPASTESGERVGGCGGSRSGAPPFALEDVATAGVAVDAEAGTSPTAAETYSRRRALRHRRTSFSAVPVKAAANTVNGGADGAGCLSPHPPSQPQPQQQQQQLHPSTATHAQLTALTALYLSPSARRLSAMSSGKDATAAMVMEDGGAPYLGLKGSPDSLRPQSFFSLQQQQQQQATHRQRVSFCEDLAGQEGVAPPALKATEGSLSAAASSRPTILQRASMMSPGSVSPFTSPAGGSVLALPHPPNIDSPHGHGASTSASIIHSNSRDGNEENRCAGVGERESPQFTGPLASQQLRTRPLLSPPQQQQQQQPGMDASEHRHHAILHPILNDRTHAQQQQQTNHRPGMSVRGSTLCVVEDGNSSCLTNGPETGLSPAATILRAHMLLQSNPKTAAPLSDPHAVVSGEVDGSDAPPAAVAAAAIGGGGEKLFARHYTPFTSRRSVARVGSLASGRSASSSRHQNFDWAGSIVGSVITMGSNSLLSSPTDSDFG